MRLTKFKFGKNRSVLLSIILFFLLIRMSTILIAEEGENKKEKDFPKYSLETLSQRYGDKVAMELIEGKVKVGYSITMVYHAKGAPYLVEEPIGENMDLEILFYQDMVIWIEYSTVAMIKELKKN